MSSKSQKFLLPEPVDYPKLAAAFIMAGWNWGIFTTRRSPRAEELEAEFQHRKIEMMKENDRSCVYNSGGIDCEWRGDDLVFLLDARLAEHYFDTHQQPSAGAGGSSTDPFGA